MNLQNPNLLRQQCYIDGAWTDAADAATIPVTNPASGEVIATIPRMGSTETAEAIAAAARAQVEWRAKLAKERASSCAGGAS